MSQKMMLPRDQRAVNNFSKAAFFLLAAAFIGIPVMNIFVRHIWTDEIKAFKLVLPVAFGAIGFLIVITAVLYQILEIKKGITFAPEHFMILGFGVFVVVSTIASINFSTAYSVAESLKSSLIGYGSRMEGALALFGYMGLYAAGTQIKKTKLIQWLLQIITGILILTNLYAFAEHAYAHFPVILRSRRAFVFCGNANFYASFLIIGISILTIALVYNKKFLNATVYPGVILMTGVGLVHINAVLGIIFFIAAGAASAFYAGYAKTQSSYTMAFTSVIACAALVMFGKIMTLEVEKIEDLGTAISQHVLTASNMIPKIIFALIFIAVCVVLYIAGGKAETTQSDYNRESAKNILTKVNDIMTPAALFTCIIFATLILLYNNSRSAWVGIAAVWLLIGIYWIVSFVKKMIEDSKSGYLTESLISFIIIALVVLGFAGGVFLIVYFIKDMYYASLFASIALMIVSMALTVKGEFSKKQGIEAVTNRGIKLVACALLFITFLSYVTIYQADLYKARADEVFGTADTDKEDGSSANKADADKYKLEKWGSGRGFIWKHAIPVMFEKPLTGYGPDHFKEAFPHMKVADEMQTIFNKKVSFDKAHNEYIQMGVTLGIPALLFYLALLVFIFIKGVRDSKTSVLKLTLLTAFTGYIVQAFFNISVLQVAPFHYAIMGLIAANILDSDPFGSPDDGILDDKPVDNKEITKNPILKSYKTKKNQNKAYKSL